MNGSARLIPNPKAKLRDQFHEVARYKHLSLRTEQTYWDWVRRYLLFHKQRQGAWRHPREMAAPEIACFPTHLAVERSVAVSTQNQALNALVFLHREVLGQEIGALGQFERSQRRQRSPVVLSRHEVERVLGCVETKYALVLRLLYGTGMRLLEGLRLRVKDVDFANGQIVVRDGAD